MTIKAPPLYWILCALWLATYSTSVVADELLFNFGGGSQPGANQSNSSIGLDYSFYRYERSNRQHIYLGVSYTYLGTNTADHDRVHAISIYPQLSLFPTPQSWLVTHMPSWASPYFFVRALGPSYISANMLGERRQANHFAFQAQVGVGATIRTSRGNEAIIAISWKHFSNANLSEDNDGIDLPFVLNIGIKF